MQPGAKGLISLDRFLGWVQNKRSWNFLCQHEPGWVFLPQSGSLWWEQQIEQKLASQPRLCTHGSCDRQILSFQLSDFTQIDSYDVAIYLKPLCDCHLLQKLTQVSFIMAKNEKDNNFTNTNFKLVWHIVLWPMEHVVLMNEDVYEYMIYNCNIIILSVLFYLHVRRHMSHDFIVFLKCFWGFF